MSYKILTIDDSRMVRLIVAKAFQPHGCEVYEASNGADGLTTAQTIVPDLIFLDITMPDMSGLVVLEKLRQIKSLAGIPIIMLTAESGNISIERADKSKVIGYISKPFKAEQLVDLAGKVLTLQSVVTS